MRILLIIVIILNAINALGITITAFVDSEQMFFSTLGRALDDALGPLSLVIIGSAVLRIFPYKHKTGQLD